MITVHINIGSNSGCRHALIERAVAALVSALPGRLGRSSFIETEPWGFDSPNTFLNLGVRLDFDEATLAALDPLAGGSCMEAFALSVLAVLQKVERSIDPSPHRDADGGYIDRAIDIDLIAVGSLVMDCPELILPHPRMHEREFVLRPMAELDPTWRHPLLNQTAEVMLTRILNERS